MWLSWFLWVGAGVVSLLWRRWLLFWVLGFIVLGGFGCVSVFSLFRFVAGGFLVGGCFRIRLQVSVVRVLFVLLGLGVW